MAPPLPLPREGVLLIYRESGAARCLPPPVICRPFRAIATGAFAELAENAKHPHMLGFRRQAISLPCEAPFSKTIGVKRPALPRGRGGGVSPHEVGRVQ